MKKMLPALCLLSLVCSSASAQIMGRPIKQYTSRMGTAVHVGDTLRFVIGQRENGSYKYAKIASQAFHSEETSLAAEWNGRAAVVTQLREIPYKTGAVITTVFKSGAFNAALNFDSAEEAGEIKTTANQKKATPSGGGGVADELIKLKSLLDAGALTQAEFEAQKTKLLAR